MLPSAPMRQESCELPRTDRYGIDRPLRGRAGQLGAGGAAGHHLQIRRAREALALSPPCTSARATLGGPGQREVRRNSIRSSHDVQYRGESCASTRRSDNPTNGYPTGVGSAILDVDIVACGWATVQLTGPPDFQLWISKLFFPLRNPANGACQRKDRREHRGRESPSRQG